MANLFEKIYSNIKNSDINKMEVGETRSKRELEDCEKSVSDLVKIPKNNL